MNPKWMLVAIAAASLLCASGFAAENYPVRPIRVLAGGAAGGPIDIMGRVIGQKLSERLGQPVVIDNRGGAGGTIATRMVAQSAPDGYTLLCNSSQFPVAFSLYKNPGYDAFKDFAPIINAGVSPNILFVHPSLPVNTLQELFEVGRTAKLTIGTPSMGSTPHLTAERLLRTMVHLDMTVVPFNGAANAMNAVITGQLRLGVIAMPPTVPFIKAGKLRGIAVTSSRRMAQLPEVATVAEAGFPGYEDYTWIGFFAPAGTPRVLVDKLNRDIAAIEHLPDTRPRLEAIGFDPISNTPGEFTAYVKTEVVKWAKVIKDAGAHVD